MFVKAANREARLLDRGGDSGPIQALRPKSTSSVLQDSLVSSRLVILFVSHISLDYTRNLQDAKITCVKNTDASLLTRFTYATEQVEFFFLANAANFILAITAMSAAVSLARTATDPVAN